MGERSDDGSTEGDAAHSRGTHSYKPNTRSHFGSRLSARNRERGRVVCRATQPGITNGELCRGLFTTVRLDFFKW